MNQNHRNTEREICFARVIIQEIPGQLRDINAQGIKVVLIAESSLKTEGTAQVQILPDETLNIADFQLKGEVKWVKNDTFGQLIGIQREPFDDPNLENSFNKLLEYYRNSEE